MAEEDNADAKWSAIVCYFVSDNQLEAEEDSERTVISLRGRLLAERMSSRKAREQAEQLGNKLMQLESLLKEEEKSRNRAEKKLKSLMKKLTSLNISYSTDESSSQMEKAEVSSVCSSTASSNGHGKDKEKNQEHMEGCDILQQLDSHPGSSAADRGFEVNLLKLRMPLAISEVLNQDVQLNSLEKPIQLNSDGKCNDSVAGEMRVESSENAPKQEDGPVLDNLVYNSLALVSVDVPNANQAVDPEVLDGTVKEVLHTLQRAKEYLHRSMERRRSMSMIKVV